MKNFIDIASRPSAPPVSTEPAKKSSPRLAAQDNDKQIFIKRQLACTLERTSAVQTAVLDWLKSFASGMSKEQFMLQCSKLDVDDNKALQQLRLSTGGRLIRLLPSPKLTAPIIDVLASYRAVAIEAAAGRKTIETFIDDLPTAGGVYILDVNELILEYVDYQHRGKAGEIIEQANRASILAIMGLEKPIALAYHIKDTLFQLAAVRKKDPDKYTVTTWNYTHAWYIPEFAKEFTHFSV